MSEPQAEPGLPLSIIGGYLGAGKTSLVNHLLRHAEGKRLAVMVNEFGSLPIDADLIEAQGDDLIALAGGCVCCSYGDDLMLALTRMRALDPAPDHILLEASGVALPGAIGAAIGLFGRDIELRGILVLADAETLAAHLGDTYLADTITRQLSAADLVILTKADLVAPSELTTAKALAAAHAGAAPILESHACDIDPAIIFADFAAKPQAADPRGAHLKGMQTETLAMTQPVAPQDVAQALAQDARVIRAKGHMISKDDGGLVTLQLVGPRFTLSTAPEGAAPGIVVISSDKTLPPR